MWSTRIYVHPLDSTRFPLGLAGLQSVPFWGYKTQTLSTLSPKRDCILALKGLLLVIIRDVAHFDWNLAMKKDDIRRTGERKSDNRSLLYYDGHPVEFRGQSARKRRVFAPSWNTYSLNVKSTYLAACLPACLPACLLACLPACLFIGSFELNKEKITQGRSGAKVCTVSLRNKGSQDGVVITTSMPTAQGQMHLVETRQLLDKGHVHAQVRDGVEKGQNIKTCLVSIKLLRRRPEHTKKKKRRQPTSINTRRSFPRSE